MKTQVQSTPLPPESNDRHQAMPSKKGNNRGVGSRPSFYALNLILLVMGMMIFASLPASGEAKNEPAGQIPPVKLGTAVDDELTIDSAGNKSAPSPSATPQAQANKAAPTLGNTDSFFAAPLGDPNNPNKYKYIGPIIGGHDPSKIDWSGYGAKSAEHKRFLMVEYAHGRLKVGKEFGGIDSASDGVPTSVTSASPEKPETKTGEPPSQPGTGGAEKTGKGEPVKTENGELAWVNTSENPDCAPPSSYQNDVRGAIDRVVAAGTGLEAPGSDHIISYDAYHAAVVSELRKSGLMALHDGEEIAICSKGDAFNEHFDISTSKGYVWLHYVAFLKPPVKGLRELMESAP